MALLTCTWSALFYSFPCCLPQHKKSFPLRASTPTRPHRHICVTGKIIRRYTWLLCRIYYKSSWPHFSYYRLSLHHCNFNWIITCLGVKKKEIKIILSRVRIFIMPTRGITCMMRVWNLEFVGCVAIKVYYYFDDSTTVGHETKLWNRGDSYLSMGGCFFSDIILNKYFRNRHRIVCGIGMHMDHELYSTSTSKI